jgi:hypothetical protein
VTGPISLVFVNATSVEDVQAVGRAFQSSVQRPISSTARHPVDTRLVEILLPQYVVSVPDSPALTAGTIRVGVKRHGATVSTAEYPQG